jgi:AbrB family looped-hinge helix DNA binding protein
MPTISQKGQVTIPVAVREELGIHPGDEVTFEHTTEGYTLRKQVADDRFEKWRGALSTDRSVSERMEELRGRPVEDSETATSDRVVRRYLPS